MRSCRCCCSPWRSARPTSFSDSVLGAWQAVRFGEQGELLDKLGSLLVLFGLFGLAGWAADQLSPGALTPSVAAMVVGLVLVMSRTGCSA